VRDLTTRELTTQERLVPNTHRRRDSTVELRRVGGVNAPVGSRELVANCVHRRRHVDRRRRCVLGLTCCAVITVAVRQSIEADTESLKPHEDSSSSSSIDRAPVPTLIHQRHADEAVPDES